MGEDRTQPLAESLQERALFLLARQNVENNRIAKFRFMAEEGEIRETPTRGSDIALSRRRRRWRDNIAVQSR